MIKIIQTIQAAFQENLEAVFLLIFATMILYLINITLGTILGTFDIGFKTKKFFFGIFKAFVVGCCIFVFSYTLNLLSLILALINVTISVDIITIMEVLGVLLTWALDLAQEILDKIKSMKELKYISYDSVVVNDYSVDERG